MGKTMNGSLTPMVAVCFYTATDQRDYFWLCMGELSLNCKAGLLRLLRSFSILSAATPGLGPHHSESGRMAGHQMGRHALI